MLAALGPAVLAIVVTLPGATLSGRFNAAAPRYLRLASTHPTFEQETLR